MRLKFILLLLAIVSATGCAELNAFRSGVASHGAEASDATLESALWVVCNGGTVGADKRRFKTAEEKAAREIICSS